MKLIPIILITLSLAHCRHYFVRDEAKYTLTQEEESILKSKKIGVIGFHPFYVSEDNGCCNQNPLLLSKDLIRALQFVYEKNDAEQIPFDPSHFITGQGKYRRDQRLSAGRTTEYYSKFERKLEKANIAKPDKSIPENNLRIFLKTYLEKAKHLGHKEILDILDFSDKNKIYLKENGFDYWIIGFHAPRESNFSLEEILTIYPFLFSLGIFPFVDHEEIRSSFWIFDKKLHLIRKLEFKDENVFYIAASWIFWKPQEDNGIFIGHIPTDVYEPDVKEFQKEFVKMIKEN